MGDVTDVRCGGSRISRLVIVAFLVPAPIYRLVLVAGNLLDVSLDIQEIERGIQIGSRGLINLVSHKGERQGGEGQVGRRVRRSGGPAFGGLLVTLRRK